LITNVGSTGKAFTTMEIGEPTSTRSSTTPREWGTLISQYNPFDDEQGGGGAGSSGGSNNANNSDSSNSGNSSSAGAASSMATFINNTVAGAGASKKGYTRIEDSK
jgi:hypothetical protein